ERRGEPRASDRRALHQRWRRGERIAQIGPRKAAPEVIVGAKRLLEDPCGRPEEQARGGAAPDVARRDDRAEERERRDQRERDEKERDPAERPRDLAEAVHGERDPRDGRDPEDEAVEAADERSRAGPEPGDGGRE